MYRCYSPNRVIAVKPCSARTEVWINAVLFQLGWFLCVLDRGMLAITAVLIILLGHFRFLAWRKYELRLLCLVAAWGFVQDAVLMQFGVFQVPDAILPPFWLMALWILFGTTLTRSLSWFQNRLWLATLAGAILGPLSYLAGDRLGAIDVSINQLPWLSLAWCLCTPLLLWLGRQLTAGERV